MSANVRTQAEFGALSDQSPSTPVRACPDEEPEADAHLPWERCWFPARVFHTNGLRDVALASVPATSGRRGQGRAVRGRAGNVDPVVNGSLRALDDRFPAPRIIETLRLATSATCVFGASADPQRPKKTDRPSRSTTRGSSASPMPGGARRNHGHERASREPLLTT
jgi:hypothetical protein